MADSEDLEAAEPQAKQHTALPASAQTAPPAAAATGAIAVAKTPNAAQDTHTTAPDTAPDSLAVAPNAERKSRSKLQQRLRRARIKWLRISDPIFGPWRRRWQRSLGMRVTTLLVATTMLLITIAGGFILSSVGDDLTQNRLDTALRDSARTTVAAQQAIDNSDANDPNGLSNLMRSVRTTIRDTSSSSLIYIRRQPGQLANADAPQDFRTGPGIMEAITPALSDAVITGEHPQVWQYIELPEEATEQANTPGVIVATTLSFPAGVGNYDLFIAYSFAEAENSLQFISRTLLIVGAVLLVLITLLSWFTVSRLFGPIRNTAETSRKLAEGDRKARMSHHNDTNFDELADNFNAMADTLSARIDELDTLSTMQQRFVSDVSHELRTPLTTIRLASEVLASSKDNLLEPQQRAVNVLDDQVRRFEELLTDLLEISRYDAGRVQLETEPTSIIELASEVIAGLQPLSNSLIELRPLGGYSQIDVDPRRIRRILSNLIGNAIEHGESRPIIVTIDSNSAALAVTVRDYGIGMTAAQTDRVFDRFWRADPARKRTLGGTGLGLSIAQEDAAVHGGLIDVWSEPGEGTNFRLTLPKRERDDSFLSPLPLLPEDATAPDSQTTSTGWIDRPRRWLLGRGR